MNKCDKFQIKNSLLAIHYQLLDKNGIAALPAVAIIAAVSLMVGLAVLGGGIIDSFLSSAQKDSTEAFYRAELGIKDALEKLSRDPSFNSVGYNPVSGDTSTNVVVQQDTFSSPCSYTSTTGYACIVSTGQIGGRTRKIENVVNLRICFGGTGNGNSCNADGDCGGGICTKAGKITQVSWKELNQ